MGTESAARTSSYVGRARTTKANRRRRVRERAGLVMYVCVGDSLRLSVEPRDRLRL